MPVGRHILYTFGSRVAPLLGARVRAKCARIQQASSRLGRRCVDSLRPSRTVHEHQRVLDRAIGRRGRRARWGIVCGAPVTEECNGAGIKRSQKHGKQDESSSVVYIAEVNYCARNTGKITLPPLMPSHTRAMCVCVCVCVCVFVCVPGGA